MSPSIHLILIGLPGSGKTTLARQVSEQLKISFFDLDDEIEKSTGRKVHDIFKSGEIEFRKIETESLKKILDQKSGFVLATGGGAPCFNNNLKLMNQSGTTIFLDVPVNEIVKRISKQSIHRPLLVGNLEERIHTLHVSRIDIYRQARFTLAGPNIRSSDIIGLIQ